MEKPCNAKDGKNQKNKEVQKMPQERILNFTLEMAPPRTTHQTKKASIVGYGRNARIRFYEPDALKMARREYMIRLAPHAPKEPLKGPIRLLVRFVFKCPRLKDSWQPKITRPDTDNMIKLLKDCMTASGFWLDDAQVYDEHIIKEYGAVKSVASRPRIEIFIAYQIDTEEGET